MFIAGLFYSIALLYVVKLVSIFLVSQCRISLSTEDGELTWQNLTLYRCSLISGSACDSKKIILLASSPQNSELIAMSASGPGSVL